MISFLMIGLSDTRFIDIQSSTKMQDRKVKVVVIGSIGVGKTSITQRYIYNEFNEKSESTLGATYGEKVHLYEGNKMLKFQLWDTAGQQKYRAIAKIYYRDCRVAVVVYDVTNHDTFVALQKWVEELKAHGPEKVLIAIVGNKIDLAHTSVTTASQKVAEQVSYEEAYEYATKIDAIFKLVSAKQNQGIQDLFNVIATRHDIMFQGQKQKKSETLTATKKNKNKSKCC